MIVNVLICSYGHIYNLRVFCLKTKKGLLLFLLYRLFYVLLIRIVSSLPSTKDFKLKSEDLLDSVILPKISTDVIKNTHYVLLRVVSSSVSKFDC